MTFADYFKQFIKDEGYDENEIWNMGLSSYNQLKKEAMKYYRDEHIEKRFAIMAKAKSDGFVWHYNSIFKQKEEAEEFAKEVGKSKGNDYEVVIYEIEVIC